LNLFENVVGTLGMGEMNSDVNFNQSHSSVKSRSKWPNLCMTLTYYQRGTHTPTDMNVGHTVSEKWTQDVNFTQSHSSVKSQSKWPNLCMTLTYFPRGTHTPTDMNVGHTVSEK